MAEDFCLTPEEFAEAQQIILTTRPGRYTLPKLYGSAWLSKLSPTTFGARFKATVRAGRLGGISLLPSKTGANHLQYLVHDR